MILTQETQNRNSYSNASSYSSEKQFMELEPANTNENHIERELYMVYSCQTFLKLRRSDKNRFLAFTITII